jgi:alanine racemase
MSIMRLPFKGTYRTLNTVRISSEALEHNLNLYRELLPGKAICPVLKANAYGHGLLEVANVLDKMNPEFFVVDSLYEAYELEKAGIRAKILILGYTFPENLKRKRLPFHFAVSDMESAEVLAKQGAKVHLKVDTGMNRMGFSMDELPEALPKLKALGLNVVGVFTHMADPDNPVDDSYTDKQLERFEKALEQVREIGFNPEWVHPGQSAGILKVNGAGNMARVGFSLYGVSPFEDGDPAGAPLRDLKPVMEFHSTLVGLRQLKVGDKVSYNGTFEADREMLIGMVPVGYYEALPRSLSNKGVLKVKGVACPIVGRICMNYTAVDLTKVENPAIGDPVEVYSSEGENSLRELAKKAETIPYELMTRVASSIRREVQ